MSLRARTESAILREWIVNHIKAVGPIDWTDIVHYLKEQWPGKLNILKANKALEWAINENKISIYDFNNGNPLFY